MTIDEVFELQRLQSEHRSTAEARDAASFMTAHILPIIRELHETRAKCSALEQQLKCTQAQNFDLSMVTNSYAFESLSL